MGLLSKFGDWWSREGMTKEQWAQRQTSLRVMNIARGHCAIHHDDGTADYYTDWPERGGVYKGSLDHNGRLVERSGPIHTRKSRAFLIDENGDPV